MVLTASTMLPLDTVLPSFELPLIVGTGPHKSLQRISNSMLRSKPLLIMVICAHCPFVKHIEQGISLLDLDYLERVYFLAVSSNSLMTHPMDAPKHLLLQATMNRWRFPYVIDHDQSFAKKLKAACTPEFFLFAPSNNGSQKLRYRGQFDESRPTNQIPVSGKDLRFALNAVLRNQEVPFDQKPSIGCNIKWNPGNEPSWFNSAG